MRRRLFSIAIITALCGAVSALGITVHKDAYEPGSVMLEDFSGTNNPASGMGRVTFDSITNGAATYTYEASGSPEGTITFGTLATPFDTSVYSSLRVRMAVDRDTAVTTPVQIYPSPVGPAGNATVNFTSGTTMMEGSFDWSSTNATGIGMRLDAFNYANDTTADQCQIDYFMADLGRTIGFEFNHDGDLAGASPNNVSSTNVANGILTCTTSTGDPQINFVGGDAPAINASIYKFVEVRMKGVVSNSISLYWNTAARGSVTPAKLIETSADSDGEYHTYLLDCSTETNWIGNLTTLRIDPATTADVTFEVDYVRFMEVCPTESPEILFFDDFDDAVDNNLTDPAARATGTLADTVKYYISGLTTAGEVAVTNGLLDWIGTNTANGDLTVGNGTQNLQLSSSAGVNSAFDWAPYVAGETYTISFTLRMGWSSPLAFGLSDTPTTGSWAANTQSYIDFAFRTYGANFQTGEDGISTNISGTAANTEYDVELTIKEVQGLAEVRVDGLLINTRSIDFENAGRYITFAEPTAYGGYIDNLEIAVAAPIAEPYAAIPTLDLIANGNEFEITNAVAGPTAGQYNVAGTFGDFSLFWGSSATIAGWTPYYSDPDGLTANVGTPGADDGGVPVLDGTFYLDTLMHGTLDAIVLNSSMNYRNGMMQEDILNGVTVKAGVNYILSIDVSQGASTAQGSATFTAALTMGAGSTNTAAAVSGSLISIAADSVPTDPEESFQTTTISGADLLAAQASGPVNMIFDHVNTTAIAGYPDSADPVDLTQVSQLRVASVSLTVNSPANDLNKDGVLDADDVTLANLYLAGDGGKTAADRQAALIAEGFTSAQALAYLNLTEFDIDGDDDFDAADITALEALLTGYGSWAANNGLEIGVNDGLLDDSEAGGGDGFNNLLEYALGGDPLVDDAAALQPALMAMSDGGTDWFYYIQSRRTDDDSLSYVVTLDDDLVDAVAAVTNAPIGQSAEVDGFTTFTNRTDLDEHEFFQLKVQKD
jgi:hypothetical protein